MLPQPAAIGIIFKDHQSQVLLVKRRDVPVWVLPGGGIDPNETPSQAVIREVLEETGFNVKILAQCAKYLPINSLANVTHVFLCRACGGKATQSNESEYVKFFPVDDLPNPIFFPHQRWIKEALTFQGEMLTRSLTEINYTEFFRLMITHPIHMLTYLRTKYKTRR